MQWPGNSETQPALTPETSAISAPATISAISAVASVAKAARLDGRRDGQIRLARGIDGEEAIRAFAVAGCLHTLDSAEGHVQQAALAAVHGREGVGDAGAAHLFRGGLGGHAQFLGAQGLEVGGVEADEAALALVQCFADPDDADISRLLKLLLAKPYVNQVAEIDIRNHAGRVDRNDPHIRIKARLNGEQETDIRFGRFCDPRGDWEVSAERKLQYLDRFYADHGRLAGAAIYIDLRYDHLRFRPLN